MTAHEQKLLDLYRSNPDYVLDREILWAAVKDLLVKEKSLQ